MRAKLPPEVQQLTVAERGSNQGIVTARLRLSSVLPGAPPPARNGSGALPCILPQLPFSPLFPLSVGRLLQKKLVGTLHLLEPHCSPSAAKFSSPAGGPFPTVPNKPHPKKGRIFHHPPGLAAKLPGASNSGLKIRVLSQASGLHVGRYGRQGKRSGLGGGLDTGQLGSHQIVQQTTKSTEQQCWRGP